MSAHLVTFLICAAPAGSLLEPTGSSTPSWQPFEAVSLTAEADGVDLPDNVLKSNDPAHWYLQR